MFLNNRTCISSSVNYMYSAFCISTCDVQTDCLNFTLLNMVMTPTWTNTHSVLIVNRPFTSIFHQCHDSDHISDPISQDIQTHLKTHSGEKSNKCNQCNYESSYVSNLRVHMKTHNGEKSKKCNQCEYLCVQASNVGSHQKVQRHQL